MEAIVSKTYSDLNINQRINLKGNTQIIYPRGFDRNGWQAVKTFSERESSSLALKLWNHNCYGKRDSFKKHNPVKHRPGYERANND